MNSPRKLYFLSEGMSFVYFWIALSVPYLQYRGLSIAEALSLMSLYQLFGVILEYPTSVFGDRFGYKLSMVIANILLGSSMFMVAQPGNYQWYLLSLFVLSLGNSFTSGNTQGLLNSITSDVRNDTARRGAIAEFVIFVSAIVGTWIGTISYEIAIYTSGAFMFAATIPLLFVRATKKTKPVESIATIFKDSFLALRSQTLQKIYLNVAVFGGFHFATKSIFGSFGQLYSYSLTAIGWLVGLGGLAKSGASVLYTRYQQIPKLVVGLVMVGTVALAGFTGPLMSAVLLILFIIAISYLLAHMDGDIHELAEDHIRSSLFSFKRLTIRLFSSIYLFFIGLAIDANRFSLFMVATGMLMLLAVYVTKSYLLTTSLQPGLGERQPK